MAQDVQPNVQEKVATPQHFVLPSARELRTQAVHRLQVGLFGLCTMLLLVVLANIVMDRARLVDENAPAAVEAAQPDKADGAAVDPLADIGVVPASGNTPAPSVSSQPAPPPTVDAPAAGGNARPGE